MVSFILREFFVVSGLHLQHMASGFTLAFPSILAPALSGDHPAMKVSDDEINIILGAYFMASPLGFMFFPWVLQRFGRKITNIAMSCCSISGSILVAVATNSTVLIIGRAFHGASLATQFISCTIAAEYTHPRRRGLHIVLKGVSSGIAEFLCHSLGLSVLTYQQTALLAIIPAIMAILVTLKWPESPHYLAYKGRYEECISAFEWIRGNDNESKKELKDMILSQKERQKLHAGDANSRFWDALRSKGFWKPMFVVFLVDIACISSACMFIISYVTEIVYMITDDRVLAYNYTTVLDILRTLSIVVSSFIVMFFKRRTVFFSFGAALSVVLVTLCLLYHFGKDFPIAVKWITPITFAMFYVIVNVAITPVTTLIQGELVPINYKGVGTFCSGMIQISAVLLIMTYTWKAVKVLDLHGFLGIHLIIFMITYVMLLKYLPETKDRTLQDIENGFDEKKLNYDAIDSKILEKLVFKRSSRPKEIV